MDFLENKFKPKGRREEDFIFPSNFYQLGVNLSKNCLKKLYK